MNTIALPISPLDVVGRPVSPERSYVDVELDRIERVNPSILIDDTGRSPAFYPLAVVIAGNQFHVIALEAQASFPAAEYWLGCLTAKLPNVRYRIGGPRTNYVSQAVRELVMAAELTRDA